MFLLLFIYIRKNTQSCSLLLLSWGCTQIYICLTTFVFTYESKRCVLDKYMNPVPIGVDGELYIGGIQVYINVIMYY